MADPATHRTPRPGVPPTAAAAGPGAGSRLLRRLLLYHFGLALALALLVSVFPALPQYLPVGGLTELAGVGEVTPARDAGPAPAIAIPPPEEGAGAMFDRIGHTLRLAIALAGVWLLMLPVSWVHKGIYRSSGYDHSLDETTLILPGVVAGIVVVVQHSLALAFALAGIVAGVHFRRALQDTFDALFILVAIGSGIAAGVAALEVAVVMTVFFCYATLYVCWFGDGLQSDYLAERKLRKRWRLRRVGDVAAKPPAGREGEG
jgi:hypothetical protein